MELKGRTVLVTGGSTGIGFRLAQELHRRQCTVIVCARREDRLARARQEIPGLITRACDVSGQADRKALVEWAVSTHPELSVLVNNAGIQRRIDLTAGARDLAAAEEEIAVTIHSFSLSLRHQLAPRGVKVFEAIPPTTDTELDQGRRPPQVRGVPAAEVARAILQAVERDQEEIPVGGAAGLVENSRKDPAAAFSRINRF